MKRLTLLIACFFLFSAASLNDARKANEAYKNGDFELAAQLFRQAIDQAPDDARLYFNLGNSLTELGETEEAMQAFEQYRSLTEEVERQAMADYNQGKILSDLEEYDQAIERFRDALRKNPGDADARYNYELAIKKKQEKEQQEQQQQDNSDSDGDQNEEENEQNQDQQQNPNEQPPQDQPQNPESQPQPQNMTPEEAENILNALEQLERELLENRKKEATTRNPDNDKDW
ncbi:tetratricopeptide repeat protein [Rhodohalobacter halophilus]|uniref:tetratricopeptide repeat protein n=1 Tax=Rhodohalobacter halophilus TaxID=1812810 RepID=UPI00083FB185|nr:tetratricopeptide repeat protein [Rhodohalobacter halophilus]